MVTLRAPDPAAVLAARHGDFLAFVTRRVRDRALAEDLLQAALARAVERIETLRDEQAVVAWFYRSLRNVISDGSRRRDAESRALAAFNQELDERIAVMEAPTPNVCRCVLEVAASLKPEYAEAPQAIEIEGAAVKAFALERGISNSNAAVRVFRAREALRRGVLAACGHCAATGCGDCSCERPVV